MEWYPSITKTFLRPLLFQHRALLLVSAMLVSQGKGPCRHHRFARALARCHCKQWVPGRLIGLGVRSFRLKILQQNPVFVMNCEKWWIFDHKNTYDLSIMISKKNPFNWERIVLSNDLHLFMCWYARTWYKKNYHVRCITSISPWYTPIHGIKLIAATYRWRDISWLDAD